MASMKHCCVSQGMCVVASVAVMAAASGSAIASVETFDAESVGAQPAPWSIRVGGGGIDYGVTNLQSVSPDNSMLLDDPEDTFSPLWERAIDEQTSGVFEISFFFRVSSTDRQQQIGSIRDNVTDVTGIGIRGDNSRLYYFDGGSFTTAPTIGGTIIPDTWYYLKQVVDLDADTWDIFLGDSTQSELFSASGLGTRNSGQDPDRVVFFDNSGDKSFVHQTWVDDFTFVPEPASLAVLSLGGIVALGRRMKGNLG